MTSFPEVKEWLADAKGSICHEQTVGKGNLLHLGFGACEPAPLQGLPDRKKYEWGIGTFSAAWRVSDGSTILCGSLDSANHLKVMEGLASVSFGNFESVEMVSSFDVRINFDSGVFVEFFPVAGFDDSSVYVIGPSGWEASYNYRYGWRLRRRPT